MMGNEKMEKFMLEFADDMRKLMIKHGVEKIESRGYSGQILVTEKGIILDRMDFILKPDPFEIGNLTLDQCLDKHNQLVQAGNVTKDPSFHHEAVEVMDYIKRRFWEVEL